MDSLFKTVALKIGDFVIFWLLLIRVEIIKKLHS